MNNVQAPLLNDLQGLSSNVKGLIFPDIDRPYDYSISNEKCYQEHLKAIVGQNMGDIVRVPIQATLHYEMLNLAQRNLAVYIEELKVGHLSQDDAETFFRLINKLDFKPQDAFHVNALIIEDSQKRSRSRGWRVKLDMPFFVGDITIKRYS